MHCPHCHHHKSSVLYVRQLDTHTERRRQCSACRFRWTTTESLKARREPQHPQLARVITNYTPILERR